VAGDPARQRRRVGQVSLGSLEEALAFAGPLGFQERVLAGHQPLAGKVRGSDLGQVRLTGQRQLQRAVADQRLDLGGAQRGDPVQPGGAHVLAQPCCGQHAPVADEHHPGEGEPVLELAHLAGDGLRVAGVALEYLDGDRDAVGGGEQPVDDLQPAADPVFGVADGAQRAGPPLERGGGHVVEDQGPAGQVPGRERVLDLLLPGGEPVHRAVQVILVTARHPQHLAQRAGRGLGLQPAGDGQLGVRRDDLRHRHRGHQVPLPRRRRIEQLLQGQRPRGAQHRGDMPVRQAAGDLERALHGGGRRELAFQHPGQGLDLGLGPRLQVGQGAVLHLACLAVAFAQQYRGR
jgi:hypothetical protein